MATSPRPLKKNNCSKCHSAKTVCVEPVSRSSIYYQYFRCRECSHIWAVAKKRGEYIDQARL